MQWVLVQALWALVRHPFPSHSTSPFSGFPLLPTKPWPGGYQVAKSRCLLYFCESWVCVFLSKMVQDGSLSLLYSSILSNFYWNGGGRGEDEWTPSSFPFLSISLQHQEAIVAPNPSFYRHWHLSSICLPEGLRTSHSITWSEVQA